MSPASHPLVSIILPTYNRKDLLKRAVKSIKAQTYHNWELIIINDGSTDGTDDYLSLLKKDKRIKIISHKHSGKVLNERSIKMARGEVITFLDDDDYYRPSHLKKNIKLFTKDPSLAILHGSPKVLGAKMVNNIHPPHKLISIKKCVVGGTIFVKKSIINKVKHLPGKKRGNDYYLHNKIIDLGFRCHKVNMPTYVYDRRGKKSITKSAKASLK